MSIFLSANSPVAHFLFHIRWIFFNLSQLRNSNKLLFLLFIWPLEYSAFQSMPEKKKCSQCLHSAGYTSAKEFDSFTRSRSWYVQARCHRANDPVLCKLYHTLHSPPPPTRTTKCWEYLQMGDSSLRELIESWSWAEKKISNTEEPFRKGCVCVCV